MTSIIVYLLEKFSDLDPDEVDLLTPTFIQKQHFDSTKLFVKNFGPRVRQSFIESVRKDGPSTTGYAAGHVLLVPARPVTDYNPSIADKVSAFHENLELVRSLMATYDQEMKEVELTPMQQKEDGEMMVCSSSSASKEEKHDVGTTVATAAASVATATAAAPLPAAEELLEVVSTPLQNVAVDYEGAVLYADMEEVAAMRYGHK